MSKIMHLMFMFLFVSIIDFSSCFSINTKIDIDPPLWPQQFSMPVYETIRLANYSYTNGFLQVNYAKNHYKLFRNVSKNQPTCSSVIPNVSYPCTHLMNNGTKYILFPDQSLCCKCCQIGDENCGFYARDWLINSTYAGYRIISWQVYEQWKISRDNTTYYYLQSSDDYRVPRMISSYNSTYQLDFFGTFNTSQIDDSVFEIPNYCNDKKCPVSQFCPDQVNNFQHY